MGYYSNFSVEPTVKEMKNDLIVYGLYDFAEKSEDDIFFCVGDLYTFYNWKEAWLKFSEVAPFPFQVTREGQKQLDVERIVFHKGEIKDHWTLDFVYPDLLKKYKENKNI
jgi:hypothetical protein